MVNLAELPALPRGGPMVVGLYSSVPRSGKTAAAQALVEDGFVRVPFAAVLRAMTLLLLTRLGYEEPLAAELVNERKECPLDALDGVTPRRLMQTLGTDWGRQLVHEELWLRCWAQQARQELAAGRRVVVDDVRFANEAALVESFPGGVMVELRRPDAEVSATVVAHASEGGLAQWPFAAVVINRGTLPELKQQIRQLIRQLET